MSQVEPVYYYRVNVYSDKYLMNIQQILKTNSLDETSINVFNLDANATYWFTVTVSSEWAAGSVSTPFKTRTAAGIPTVPRPACGYLPQATWMASVDDNAETDNIPWNDGFSLGHPPTVGQSVHIDLVGDHRHVLISDVNVTVGSMEMFGRGSYGSDHRVIVANNSMLTLSKWLQECYVSSTSMPQNISVFNITWNSVVVSWKPPPRGNNVVSYILHVIDMERNVVVQRQRVAGDQLHYKLVNLTAETVFSIDVTAGTEFAHGLPSKPVVFLTLIHVIPPRAKCSSLPQATWMVALSDTTEIDIPWNDGFSLGHRPAVGQSVHIDLVGDHRHVLISDVNVTVGSMEMFGPGSYGSDHRVIVANNSMVTLSTWLQECYSSSSSTSMPRNISVFNITWNSVVVTWKPPLWGENVASYALHVMDVERNAMVQQRRVSGENYQCELMNLPPETLLAIDVTAETQLTRGISSEIYIMKTLPPPPPPPPKICFSNAISTFQSTKAKNNWQDGFSKLPSSSQSVKLNGLGNLEVAVTEGQNVTIGSLQILGAVLILKENATVMKITTFLDHCFAATASAPTNLTVRDSRWLKTPEQYYEATVQWSPPESSGGSLATVYVLQVVEATEKQTQRTFMVPSNVTSILVKELYGDKTYLFSVAANSQFGQGAFSSPVLYTAPPPVNDCGLRAIFRSDVDDVDWKQRSKNGDLQLKFGDLENWQDDKPSTENGAQIAPR